MKYYVNMNGNMMQALARAEDKSRIGDFNQTVGRDGLASVSRADLAAAVPCVIDVDKDGVGRIEEDEGAGDE